jgi:hypothetical protein
MTMKNLNNIICIALLCFLTLACGTKKPETVPSDDSKGKPSWILAPGPLAAVGIENSNVMDDEMMQRKIALAAARTELGKQMQVQVQGTFSRLDQQYKTGGSDGKKPISAESMARMVEDANREIVNVSLVGATPREFWTDPKSKKLYVLVALDKDAADRAVKVVASAAIRRELKTGGADLQDALGRLDKVLANQNN